MIRKWIHGVMLPALGLSAILAPVRFSSTEAAATAECTTCCKHSGSLCVVCGKTCLAVENSYDIGGGACPT